MNKLKQISILIVIGITMVCGAIALNVIDKNTNINTPKKTSYYLYGEITNENIVPLVKLLNNAKEGDEITLYVSSPGGDAEAAMDVLAAEENTKATVNAIVKSWAASGAAFILCGANTVTLYPNVIVLYHTARSIDPAGNVTVFTQANAPDEFTRRVLAQLDHALKVCGNHLSSDQIDRIHNGEDVIINGWSN